jgi:hypothetical protein
VKKVCDAPGAGAKQAIRLTLVARHVYVRNVIFGTGPNMTAPMWKIA